MKMSGMTFTGESGQRYVMQDMISSGGQGFVYPAIDTGGNTMIAKVFKPQYCTDRTRRRLNFLVSSGFTQLSSVICAPSDIIDSDGYLGHVSPRCDGETLSSLIDEATISFQDGLQIAIALTHAFAVCHENGVAHGDPHNHNALVAFRNGFYETKLIDFDNFWAAGVDPPDLAGHPLFMAPEIYLRTSGPTIQSDCYALALMLHELVLRKRACHGYDATPEEYRQAMQKGYWLLDPARETGRIANDEGYSVRVLNAELTSLFRRGINADIGSRPSALEWRDALRRSLFQICACPKCGAPDIADNSKRSCPMCQIPYGTLALSGTFGTIPLRQSATVITRDLLGGNTTASARHAIIRRIGPEYRVEDTSRNGTFRFFRNSWLQLPTFLISSGDRVRFGDVEAVVQNT